jgi:hypothetical protein
MTQRKRREEEKKEKRKSFKNLFINIVEKRWTIKNNKQ